MPNSNIDIIHALDKIRLNNLYVHNDKLHNAKFVTEEVSQRKVYLVETLAVINALVDRGTMLLFGGHGGGKTTLAKYLGQIFYRLSKDEIEDCILRGHPQLTEEKILGSLDIAQLTGAKKLINEKIEVLWNTFVDSPWKIIDELNRLSPYAQNILLSLLAESSVKYHNESKRLPNFSLYATMNPKDDANFSMSLPFLDRFAIAIPMTMPDYESLSTIGKLDKSSKRDDLLNYLQNFNLEEVQNEIREINLTEDADLFINYLISSFRLCKRITKEANDSISVDNGLCAGCHHQAPEKVCNKVVHPLSVRVKEDLYRYSKALAWFLGDIEVKYDHIFALAPFMIWHRSTVSKLYLKNLRDNRFTEKKYSVNIELEATKSLIEYIGKEFIGLKHILKEFEKIKKGKLSVEEFNQFESQIAPLTENILILERDLAPVLLEEYSPIYREIIEYNNKINEASNLDELNSLKEELSLRYDIPNRNYLADLIEKERRKKGSSSLKSYKFTVEFEEFYESTKSSCQPLYQILRIRFPKNFDPAIRKGEELANIGDSDYTIRMQKVILDGGKYGLIFDYLGNPDNQIYEYLEKMNVSK